MIGRKIRPLIAAAVGAGGGFLVSRWTACRGG